jgi:hypothetical protein
MKLLEFLKKPMSNYNNRSNQKRFILESEIQLCDQMADTKKNYSIKTSKRFLHSLMQKKLYSNHPIKCTRSDQSQQNNKKLEEATYANMCFDNFAYGSFMSNEMNSNFNKDNLSDIFH